MNKLMAFMNAIKLEDLTTEALRQWRQHIETTIPKADTRSWYYNQPKNIIGFGRKMGLDADQINEALSRMKVLWTGGGQRAKLTPLP